ncbi:MAG: tRNA epoxyqueuosine(34) reductase QueG [Bacteroidales bacterium]|jgi:epoxyqueuosine reductase|nr:tRNA epoxyqueuosine(34) reductase QueG [Bacteroidales bacterium]
MQIDSFIIKQLAQNCGFDLCGIAKAKPLSIAKERFENAVANNFHAKKEYLERDIERRFHPALLFDNCKTVIVCGFNYNMRERACEKRESAHRTQNNLEKYKISKYAQIKDYHVFMKEKLERLAQGLKDKYGDFNYKTTVDSSTISEKAWAVQAGVGYYGKNGIIQTSLGSFVFLGVLLIDKDVDKYEEPSNRNCGNCCLCMAACPNRAIIAPYCVDSNRCISTINLNKNETNFSSIAQYGWIVGCDECQEVCPNNKQAPISKEALALQASFFDNQNKILETLTPESFECNFKDTNIYKLKYEGLKIRMEAVENYFQIQQNRFC